MTCSISEPGRLLLCIVSEFQMKNLNNFLFPLQAKNKRPAQKPEGYRRMGIKLETLSPVVQKVKALQEHHMLILETRPNKSLASAYHTVQTYS